MTDITNTELADQLDRYADVHRSHMKVTSELVKAIKALTLVTVINGLLLFFIMNRK